MTDLQKQLTEALAYNDDDTRDKAKHEDSDGYFGFISGAEYVHDRLSPIHTALIEAVGALEDIEPGECDCNARPGLQCPMHMIVTKALTKLTQVLKDMK